MMRVSRWMNRTLPIALTGVLLALAGCASNDDNVIADEQSGQIDFKTKSEARGGQTMSEDMLENDAHEIERDESNAPGPRSDAGSAPSDGVAITTTTADASTMSVRDDGRPSWWFSGPRQGDDQLSVCAEALGPDMRLTREAAIDAGRARLRTSLDLPASDPLPDVQILRAWVWPLPNAQAGGNRYAGYVLMSAALTP